MTFDVAISSQTRYEWGKDFEQPVGHSLLGPDVGLPRPSSAWSMARMVLQSYLSPRSISEFQQMSSLQDTHSSRLPRWTLHLLSLFAPGPFTVGGSSPYPSRFSFLPFVFPVRSIACVVQQVLASHFLLTSSFKSFCGRRLTCASQSASTAPSVRSPISGVRTCPNSAMTTPSPPGTEEKQPSSIELQARASSRACIQHRLLYPPFHSLLGPRTKLLCLP